MRPTLWSLMVFVSLIAATLDAQPLFRAVEQPVMPDPRLDAVFGRGPTIRARQTTLDAQYFASQASNPSGELVLNLFPDYVVRSKRNVVTIEGEGRYTWRGTVEGAVMHGRAVFAVVGNQIAGIVQRDDRMFFVRPIGQNEQMVAEINQSAFPREEEASRPFAFESMLSLPNPPAEAIVGTGASYTIGVMLVYPQGSWIACNSNPYFFAPGLIELTAETNLNDVWDRFTIDTITADVSIYCDPTYVAVGGDLTADHAWVASDANVLAARDARLADVVSLIVPDIPAPTSCGLAYTNEPPSAADEAFAYNVVWVDCALPNFSLAHEIGHNMGLDDDRFTEADGATSTDCNFGYSFTLNGTPAARDVMAQEDYCDSLGLVCPRLGRYSADLLIGGGGLTFEFGKPCIDPAAASNIRAFVDAAPIVSLWR